MRTAKKVRDAAGYGVAQMAKALGMNLNSYIYLEESGQSTRNDVQAKLKKLYMTTKGAKHETFDKWMEEDGEAVNDKRIGRPNKDAKVIPVIKLGKKK
jgi:transcriptional regulator with XRE-family HTH domain